MRPSARSRVPPILCHIAPIFLPVWLKEQLCRRENAQKGSPSSAEHHTVRTNFFTGSWMKLFQPCWRLYHRQRPLDISLTGGF